MNSSLLNRAPANAVSLSRADRRSVVPILLTVRPAPHEPSSTVRLVLRLT